MSIEEIEELNPHFRWCKRKMKSRVKHLAKKLALNSFAIGCRGHAGIVVEKTIYHSDITGSDVEIASGKSFTPLWASKGKKPAGIALCVLLILLRKKNYASFRSLLNELAKRYNFMECDYV